MLALWWLSSMSEDDGHESGCDTVEGSPTSDTSTSPRGNSPYHYLDNGNHNNHPPLAAVVAPLAAPAVQGRSPRGVRTMVVPPMRVQNNNSVGTEECVQRTGQCHCLPLWHGQPGIFIYQCMYVFPFVYTYNRIQWKLFFNLCLHIDINLNGEYTVVKISISFFL